MAGSGRRPRAEAPFLLPARPLPKAPVSSFFLVSVRGGAVAVVVPQETGCLPSRVGWSGPFCPMEADGRAVLLSHPETGDEAWALRAANPEAAAAFVRGCLRERGGLR